MNLDSLAKQTNVKPSEAKMLHQRPAMIQELWWQRSLASPSPETDPVREVIFSFYNGELFRMVVNYDRYRTEGLTDADMIGAISAKYGIATRPTAEIVSFSSSQVYNDSEKVLARWEDAQYSFNLFRFAYRPTFGMVLFSKRLDALAQAAVVEAIWLDEQEAPQREVELQNKLPPVVVLLHGKDRQTAQGATADDPNLRTRGALEIAGFPVVDSRSGFMGEMSAELVQDARAETAAQ